MIITKKDLEFYIAADRIMNGYPAFRSIKDRIKETVLIGGGKTMVIKYLYRLRRYAYYYNNHKKLVSFNSVMMLLERYKLNKLAVRLGFSIGTNSLGYGVVIPHYGTIVVNDDARIGNYAVLHTCTCIAGGDKEIGDGFYLSTGSQVVGAVKVGEGVTVAAHSLVNKSFKGNTLLVGAPTFEKRSGIPVWYEKEERYAKAVKEIDKIRKQIYGQ